LRETVDSLLRNALPFRQVMTVADRLDPQRRFEEKERSRRADEEALRSGRKSEAQLKRENEAFAFPRGSVRIRLDRAKSLH
jgi:hypothetical protein